MAFGDLLKEKREASCMSQGVLSKRCGISRAAITHLEAGTREPSWDTVQRLCLGLGCTPLDLVDYSIEVPGDDVEIRGRGRPKKEPAKKKGKRK